MVWMFFRVLLLLRKATTSLVVSVELMVASDLAWNRRQPLVKGPLRREQQGDTDDEE